jgi:iron(III) transport system ATP-binding protein
MRSEIHRLQRRLSITSVYVTHDQEEAMSLSDRIVVMNLGKIEQIGTPEDIYRYPKTRFVADFIGRANFFETKVDKIEDGRAVVEICGRSVRAVIRDDAFHAGERVTVMLRPEAVVLRADSALPQVAIDQVMYLGSEVEYTANLGDQTWVIADNDPRSGRAFNEGDTAGIDFVEEAVHLLKAD